MGLPLPICWLEDTMPPPGVPDLIDVELQGGPCDGKRITVYAFYGAIQQDIGWNNWHLYERTDKRTKDGFIIFEYKRQTSCGPKT